MADRIVKRIGDVNPIEYGGGVVFKTEYGHELEYTHGLEDGVDTPQSIVVYRVDVAEDVWEDLDWADIFNVADSVGVDAREMETVGRSRNLGSRVLVMLDIAGYYGWGELDQYPAKFSERELERRWRL